MAEKKKTTAEIVSEMTGLIVEHLETMPVGERKRGSKPLKKQSTMAGSAGVLVPKLHQPFVPGRSLVISQLKKRCLEFGQVPLVHSPLN